MNNQMKKTRPKPVWKDCRKPITLQAERRSTGRDQQMQDQVEQEASLGEAITRRIKKDGIKVTRLEPRKQDLDWTTKILPD